MVRPLLAAALLALILAACGNAGPEPTSPVPSAAVTTRPPPSSTASVPPTSTSSSTSSTAAGSTTTTTAAAPSFSLTVLPGERPRAVVLDSGSEPRSVLRAIPVVGDRQTVVMTSTFRTTQTFNEDAPVISDLEQTFTMQSTVLEDGTDGFVVESTVLGVEVETADPNVQNTLQQLFAFLPGVSTYSLVAPDGAVVAADNSQMQAYLSASAQTIDLSMLGNVVPPYPEEAVGSGAVWQVATTIEQELLFFTQVATYTLVERDGDVVTMDVEIEQALGNPETLGAGIENAEVVYRSVATGRIVADLTMVMPLESVSSLIQTIEIRGDSGGQAITYATRNEIGFEISSG